MTALGSHDYVCIQMLPGGFGTTPLTTHSKEDTLKPNIGPFQWQRPVTTPICVSTAYAVPAPPDYEGNGLLLVVTQLCSHSEKNRYYYYYHQYSYHF